MDGPNFITGNAIVWATPLSLVNVVCECPLQQIELSGLWYSMKSKEYVYLGNLHTLLRILTYQQTVPSFSESGQIVFFEKPVIATFKVHIS